MGIHGSCARAADGFRESGATDVAASLSSPKQKGRLSRPPMQGRLRKQHIRKAGPHLRGLLQLIQGTQTTRIVQVGLLLLRLF